MYRTILGLLIAALPVVAAHETGRLKAFRLNFKQGHSFCGRTLYVPPAIEPESLGPISVYGTIEQVRSQCPEARDTVDDQGLAALVLSLFGSTILVTADIGEVSPRGVIQSIRILGGRLRTREGLGAGSTPQELMRAYGPLVLHLCGERLRTVSFVAYPGIAFHFNRCITDREVRHGRPPAGVRATGVEIFAEID
jgi:hypothetical protein